MKGREGPKTSLGFLLSEPTMAMQKALQHFTKMEP